VTLLLCAHMKMGGGRCGSPALRGQHYCYFHAPSYRTIPTLDLWPEEPVSESYAANVALRRRLMGDEGAAIQEGFFRAVRALMEHRVNLREGRKILKTLYEASNDWRRRTATGNSAVTSNQLPSPITGISKLPGS
jgi:hypothetical protein